ncbi:MAG: ABC transporter permease [Gemmatimonadaceae bacterium]
MTRQRSDDDLPLSRTRAVADDVRSELEFHLRERTKELQANGMSAERAEQVARESFGDREAVEEECEQIESRIRNTRRRADRLGALRQDITVGWRVLRKQKGFSLAAILMLALGIGANSAVFSIVNRVLLQPLPFVDADRLVMLVEKHANGGYGNLPWSNFVDLRAQSKSFDAMASYGASPTTVLGTSAPTRVIAGEVSADFFRIFSVKPMTGRLMTAEEHQFGGAPTAVVSYAFWRDHLGSPASLDGIYLRMDREYAVVGVLPSSFDFPEGNQIWVPMEQDKQSLSRTSHNWDTVGKLKATVTAVAAQKELDAILLRLAAQHGNDFDAVGSTVTGLQESLNGSFKTPLYLMLGASALVLLAACVNLAGAMLARGTARSGEFNVRFALGATRSRLIRQLVTESALLAVGGCVSGLLLAEGLLKLLTYFAPAALHVGNVHVDGWVESFALCVAVFTTVMFGLLPALRLSNSNMSIALREGSRGTSSAGRMRVWNVLVATEVALAVVLLSGSALLIKSFNKVLQNKLGFDATNVVTVQVNLPEATYLGTSPNVSAFHERVLATLRSQPGIDAVGFANVLPLSGNNPSGSLIVEGKPLDSRGQSNAYAIYRVGGGEYFSALGIQVVKGRAFRVGGKSESAPSVVVSEKFAQDQWPNGDPIGKRVKVAGMDGGTEPWYTVIGVVANVRTNSATSPFTATYYFDHRDRPAYRSRQVTYAIRSHLNLAAIAPIVRKAVSEIDPQVPLIIGNMPANVSRSVATRRFPMLVFGAFALVALVMAIVGIHAVVSYAVAQRTREIGVRLALGATPVAVQSLVLKSALAAVIPGLVFGAAFSMAGAGFLRTLLYGVSPFDPIALIAAVAVLGVAALASSALPALRATRVDPLVAMRAE